MGFIFAKHSEMAQNSEGDFSANLYRTGIA